MNERRKFLKSSMTIALGASVGSQLEKITPIDEKFALVAGPYLQTSFGNEMTILWINNKNAFCWVQYGISPEELNMKAHGQSEFGLRPANTNLAKVTLSDLIPGKTYYYQIFSKEIVEFKPYKLTYGSTIASEIFQFVNLDNAKEEINFLMLNDIHDRPKSITQLYGLAGPQKYDFVFFNGDIFDYQTDEKQIINNFISPCCEAFSTHTPFLYVRGNHETRGKFAREFPNYFQEVGFQAFSLGPARFIIIDTGEDKPDSEPVYAGIVDFDAYREQQAAWLAKEIESKSFKNARFRVVMMHIPPRFSGDWHGPKHCTTLFEPLLNKGKVDLVLSGHTHKYAVHLPDPKLNKYALLVGGGPAEGKRTFTKVSIQKNAIRVNMYDDTGKEVGKYTTPKK